MAYPLSDWAMLDEYLARKMPQARAPAGSIQPSVSFARTVRPTIVSA